MGKYAYVTNRVISNKSGEEKGKLLAYVLTGETIAHVNYVCAECGHSEEITQVFKRPFKVRCSECNVLIKVPKLKNKK